MPYTKGESSRISFVRTWTHCCVAWPVLVSPERWGFCRLILACLFGASCLYSRAQYLEEDRRRVLLAAKEARSNRRKDDRQLKEYVHTLEVHLDQVIHVLSLCCPGSRRDAPSAEKLVSPQVFWLRTVPMLLK